MAQATQVNQQTCSPTTEGLLGLTRAGDSLKMSHIVLGKLTTQNNDKTGISHLSET
jgi:hypothetical protein